MKKNEFSKYAGKANIRDSYKFYMEHRQDDVKNRGLDYDKINMFEKMVSPYLINNPDVSENISVLEYLIKSLITRVKDIKKFGNFAIDKKDNRIN